MPEDKLTTVQLPESYREKLRQLSQDDYRSMTSEVQWLIDQEWSRRHSQPNELITIQEAIEANEAIK